MKATIEIKEELHGNVKVTVEHRGHAIVNVWRMSEAEARVEAEEIIHRMGW